MHLAIVVAFLGLCALAMAGGPCAGTTSGRFKHPGVLVDRTQLDFVKAKLVAGEQPWTEAYTALYRYLTSKGAFSGYVPMPRASVNCGGFSKPNEGCSDEMRDSTVAYGLALQYYLKDDLAAAQTALRILDAWSAVQKKHTLSNAPLQASWAGQMWVRSAELLRYTLPAGTWPAANIARFKKMLTSAYLPYVIKGAPAANGNWDLSFIEATMYIGIFTDNRGVFNQAIKLWCRRVPAYIYDKKDGATPKPPPSGPKKNFAGSLKNYWYGQVHPLDGQCQESCRDLGHARMGLASLGNVAETAWLQRVNLYAVHGPRIVKGVEFQSKFIAPIKTKPPKSLCGGKLTLDKAGLTTTLEILYNHYVNRKGMKMPFTARTLAASRPTRVGLQNAWETLTHANTGLAGHAPL